MLLVVEHQGPALEALPLAEVTLGESFNKVVGA